MTLALSNIAKQLLEKDANSNDELELCKLCLSSTISYVSPKINAMLESLLPNQLHNGAKAASKDKKADLQCSPEMIKSIEDIIHGPLPFEND